MDGDARVPSRKLNELHQEHASGAVRGAASGPRGDRCGRPANTDDQRSGLHRPDRSAPPSGPVPVLEGEADDPVRSPGRREHSVSP
ncbi:hypothetical protein AB433_04265 [Croceicoccus naphthovorans]|uniref:Uncharacterized protein n=1 Tax=Croceicoccus naphthovorans TaxID=1348774 RepID=A0A0G3XDU8_9SPHN|nr:hypothetical protein AB433_04265 [Croceicoccus naphthovorans]